MGYLLTTPQLNQNQMSIPFTDKERTVKDKTVGQAIESAAAVLKAQYNSTPMCVNAISGKEKSDQITLMELSTLVEQLIDDSLYYNGEH